MSVFQNITTEQYSSSVRHVSLREAPTECQKQRFPQHKSDFSTRYSGFSVRNLGDTELCVFFSAALHFSEDVYLPYPQSLFHSPTPLHERLQHLWRRVTVFILHVVPPLRHQAGVAGLLQQLGYPACKWTIIISLCMMF